MNWMKLIKNLSGATCLIILVALNAVADQQTIKQPASLAVEGMDDEILLTSCKAARCSKKCQCCEHCCCPKVVEAEEKKHCWKVSPRLVCIPSFRWPWECLKNDAPDCGDNCQDCQTRCGHVRCVNVLEKHEYACKKCSYEWTVKRVCSQGSACDIGNCCCPECGCADFK